MRPVHNGLTEPNQGGNMTTVSKMVSDRTTIGRTVQSSLEVHGPEAISALEAILFPNGVPQNLTMGAIITALQSALERVINEMTAADLGHAAELADNEGYRIVREQRVQAVRHAIFTFRGSITNLYGAELLRAYGVPAELPTDPQLLSQTATNIEGLLRTRPLTEKPKLPGFSLDLTAIADGFAATVKDLEAALADIKRDEREDQLTLQTKHDAMARWSSVYQGIANIAVGIFILIGRSDLAERVRPTARRRAGIPEPSDIEPPPPAATPAQPTA